MNATPASPAVFDTRDYRNALGAFATGVTVVTTRSADGKAVGLTCNSFSSVSLSPPLILWSLSAFSPNLAVFQQATNFAVNILAASQIDLSRRFSQSVADRFAGVEFSDGEGGVPLLEGVAAQMVCRNEARHYSGDHVIMIGHVIHYSYRDVEPLVFSRGRYRILNDPASPATS